MVGAEAPLVEIHGPFAILGRLFVLALLTEQQGEVAERHSDIGMVMVERLLENFELVERHGLVVLALRNAVSINRKVSTTYLRAQQFGEFVQCRGDLGAAWFEDLLMNSERPFAEP